MLLSTDFRDAIDKLIEHESYMEGRVSMLEEKIPRLFPIFDATRFPSNPDKGFPKLPIIPESAFRVTATTDPDKTYIQQTLVPTLKRQYGDFLERLVLDVECWKLYDPQNYVALPDPVQVRRHVDLVLMIKDAWPDVQVMYYGELPIRSVVQFTGTPERNAMRAAALLDKNDALLPIAQVVDALMGSFYLSLGATQLREPELRRKYLTDMAMQSRRISLNKPCYATLWNCWTTDPYDTIDYMTWYSTLETLFPLVDGVAIWSQAANSPEWNRRVSWFEATCDFRMKHSLLMA